MVRKICLTGACPRVSRERLIKKINDNTALEVAKSVTYDTDILVCENPLAGTNKLKEAAKKGVRIISYAQFYNEFPEMLI